MVWEYSYFIEKWWITHWLWPSPTFAPIYFASPLRKPCISLWPSCSTPRRSCTRPVTRSPWRFPRKLSRTVPFGAVSLRPSVFRGGGLGRGGFCREVAERMAFGSWGQVRSVPWLLCRWQSRKAPPYSLRWSFPPPRDDGWGQGPTPCIATENLAFWIIPKKARGFCGRESVVFAGWGLWGGLNGFFGWVTGFAGNTFWSNLLLLLAFLVRGRASWAKRGLFRLGFRCLV